jgi:tetratricopeptide (TPR) repeat protein
MQNSSAFAPKGLTVPSAAWTAEKLHSWKEIASFFHKEVRTVQLWEKGEGLPVRRQHHKKLGSVYAYRHELEGWWSARSALSGGAAARELPGERPMRQNAPPSIDAAACEHGPAYHACMMGSHFWKQRTRTDLMKALGYFQDAVLLDPLCSDAYAGLTDTYVSLSYNHFMPARGAMEAAHRAVAMALMLDPKSIKVRNAEINFKKNCIWDWESAERACQEMVNAGSIEPRTLQLYADLMINLGRSCDAISLALHAHRIEPLSESANSQVSFAYFYAGDYESAISFIRRTIALRPLFHIGHALLGRAEAQRGNWDEAIESFRRGLSLSSNSISLKALLAYAYAGRGDAPIANGILREIEERRDDACFPAVDVSAVYAMLNQEDKALQNISRAYYLRDIKVAYMRHDPRFSRLRALPQFQQMASSVLACPS